MNDALLQLQSIEQNLAVLRTQKNSVQSKLLECQNALREITKSQTCYKFIGNIMVLANADDLKLELSSTESRLQRTKESLEKQEQAMLQTKEKLQTELLG
jgi:chaperonin cofactor prefoldin